MVGVKRQAKKTKRKRHVDKVRNLKIVLRTAEHYRTIMPDKKGHRIAIWVAFFVVSAIIAVQLLYPFDRALPFARIDTMRVGFSSHDEMAKLLTEQFDKTKVKLTVEGRSVEYALKSAGAEPNTERMIERLSDYPFWQRFIPLSLVWQMPQVKEADVFYTDSVLHRFSEERRTQLSFGPANARLALRDGKIVATSEKPGSETTTKQVHVALANAHLQLGKTTTVKVPTKKLLAAHPMSELKVVKAQAESALTRQVAIKVNDKTFTPDKAKPALRETATYLESLKRHLESGTPLSALPSLDQDMIADLHLLTAKPVIYAFNVDENTLTSDGKKAELSGLVAPAKSIFVCAKLEEEIKELTIVEAQELLESYGVSETGLQQMIHASYSTLGLQSYLTAGPKEVRAWTIKEGSTAPQAAGVIHTDFERGFIAAQIVDYNDLITAGSETAARSAGKIRTEGKTYIMQPDDVVEFRFNV